MWDPVQLLASAGTALQSVATSLEREQAVHGLDSLTEVSLHPLLAHGFTEAGWFAIREALYPGEVARRLKRSFRERCDIVLLPTPCRRLVDPVAELMTNDRAAGTLFEKQTPPPPAGAACSECYWMEVKGVGQYTYTQGVPGPNRTWASELVGGMYRDLRKLGADRHIRHGGLLLVLFTETSEVADHDLGVALHRAMDRGVAMRSPRIERFEIANRVGNGTCTLALIERTSV